MDSYFKILAGIFILFLSACSEYPPQVDPMENFSQSEKKLIANWQYESIYINGFKFDHATSLLEPGTNVNLLGGARAEIDRRMISYTAEKTYQLLWIDRGNYNLGTAGTPNWQPNFGYWFFNEPGDTLIHNYGTTAETRYKITLAGNIMTRTSNRYMASSLSIDGNVIWNYGDVVTFREVFRLAE